MGNTSYFLYKKYRVVGSDLVATGEESVDADGTMPLVVRMDDDPSCGFDPPGTRHRTTTGSPYCVGYKKYVDVQYWASYDDGQSWIVTATTNDLVEEYSEDCGFVMKAYMLYDDGTEYAIPCDSSTTLSQNDVRRDGYELSAITEATVGSCVTSIGSYAFYNAASMSSVTLHNDITSIGSYAFYNNKALISIDIPSGITVINEDTFANCSSLTGITIPDGVTSIGSDAFSSCSGLASVNIGSGVTSIGNYAFRRDYSLSEIVIPDSVTSIGSYAFGNNSGLTTVSIGSGITSIGQSAFRFCSGLTSITVNAVTPPTLGNNSVFADGNDCPIYVPCNSVDAYKAATRWSTYASRIQGIPPCGDCVCTAYSYSDTAMTVASGSSTIYTGITYTGCVKMNVSVTAAGDFIHISSHNATSDGVWTLSLAIENNTGQTRTGTVTFSLGDTQCQTVTITQEEGYVPPEPMYRWVRTDDTVCVDYGSPGSSDYLTFRTISDCTFKMTKDVSYSVDSGNTWLNLAANTDSPIIASGNDILWKGAMPTQGDNVGTFSSNGMFVAQGNVMSLIYGDNFIGQTDLTGMYGIFKELFLNCSGVTTSNDLVLPATTLADSCYESMFEGCTNLLAVPELPALELKTYCYHKMFSGCGSLEIPQSTLPATSIADYCYQRMFYGCASLMVSPILVAERLGWRSHAYMFYLCPNLRKVTCLANFICDSDQYCYSTYWWLGNVSSTGRFYKNPSFNWRRGGSGVPNGWEIINYDS